MGYRPVNDPYGGVEPIADKLIGNAYDTVRTVATNIAVVKHVSANLGIVNTVNESLETITLVADSLELLDAVAPTAIAAAASATAAAASAAAAATSETNAGASEDASAISEAASLASQVAAAASASTATTQATAAGTSATAAATSATAAAGSATSAGTSATAAATSETNAGNSATASATSAAAALVSQNAAAASAASIALPAHSAGKFVRANAAGNAWQNSTLAEDASGNVAATGSVTAATGLTVSAGGAAITGNSTVTGSFQATTTVTVGTGLTVTTGGAAITGNATVTGNLVVASGALIGALGTAAAVTYGFASDPNTGMYSSTANELCFATAGTDRLVMDTNGNFGLGIAPVNVTDARLLYLKGPNSGSGFAGFRLVAGTSSATGTIQVSGSNADLLVRSSLGTVDIIGGGLATGLRVTAAGEVQIGQTSTSTPGIANTTTGFSLTAGGRFFSSAASGSAFNLNADGTVLSFARSGVLVGGVSVTTTTTTYATSSDYRLKQDVVPLTGAIERLAELKPSRFRFKRDLATTVDGFIAHEVGETVPEAVVGSGKDAVDEAGNPVYQGVDAAKLVPLLTAALQETLAKLEALTARVAALEGA
jgi:hypothetical protein